MIVVAGDAPLWAADLARQIDDLLTQARLGPFVSFTIYPAAGDLPDPAKHDGKLIFLSGGTFWLAQAIAGVWTYPDNTPV